MTGMDFRSDTVTRPTAMMREVMAEAEVGDDVLGDDPTVIRLQERVAKLLGKEAALFVPSGTMSNLIAVKIHCSPGDEILCEAECHIYFYEAAGYAQVAGAAIQPIPGARGVLSLEDVEGRIRPDDIHFARTRLLTLENTHNRAGGKILPLGGIEQLCGWARENGLATHLDGARLWNAVVATGIEPDVWASHFDTISVCLSKGLGAPVGSVLCGSRAMIEQGRRVRKVLGGGMRQSGILAAAALHALEHHLDGLLADHANAQALADAIERLDGLSLSHGRPETNMVFFDVAEELGTAEEFARSLADHGVLMLALGPRTIRAVTHLDITSEATEAAVGILSEVAATK